MQNHRLLAEYGALSRPSVSHGAVLEPLRKVAGKHRRFGHRKLGILLRRDGIIFNDKKL